MNKVMLIGRVDKTPEVRYVDKGICVANLTLQTTERGAILPDGTQKPDINEWHRIVLWRQLGEIVEQNVHEGDRLYVEGKLHYRTYTDQSGTSHRLVEIWAESLEIL